MKKGLFLVLLCVGIWGRTDAQLNNEWIDYSKTYYKFKLAADGLYRIPFTTLQQAGLSNVPMEQFQLFRNGQEVPLVTSKTNGLPGATDFIEFYGKMNDGRQDAAFYRQASLQPDNTWSLLTDSATYFLTVESTGAAQRFTTVPNNVAGNTLPAESYFIHTFVRSFRDRFNQGFAAVTGGGYLYSSSFDQGEGWASRDIAPSSPLSETYNLFPFQGGPNAVMSVGFSGRAPNGRVVEISVNGTRVINESTSSFAAVTRQVSIPVSGLGRAGGDQVLIRNNSTVGSDRLVVSNIRIVYPRTFNFGGAGLFEFSLPPNNVGQYLEITNFNHGGQPPLLLDLTNRRRYIGVIDGGVVKVRLESSVQPRQLVLINAVTSGIQNIASLEQRTFVDYSLAANQGDYLIIAHPVLFSGPGGNPVENYRLYRSSALGGAYTARLYEIGQLIDQFGFGIQGNALAIKNFLQMTRQRFSRKPRFVFLMGRGLQYDDNRNFERFPATARVNLLPTFGSPGSDNLMVSSAYDVGLDIPVGRLSVVTGAEVDSYLQKVKQMETVVATAGNTVAERAWMKNVVHAIGGGDPYLQQVIASYMNVNKNILLDTSVGAKVYTFSKSSALGAEILTSDQLGSLFDEGIGLLTYFGHSSTNILEFNIDNPETYNNTGKYPLFLVNGCLAGNIFVYDTMRLRGTLSTLSERYMLTPEKGSIGFIASTHFGEVNYLNIYTNGLYRSYSTDSYGKSIGEMHQSSLQKMRQNLGSTDFYARMHMEQIILHGDPAVAMYGYSKPDYVLEDQMVKISPNPVSVADNRFQVDIYYANIGRAVNDSIRVRVQRQLPGGSIIDLFNRKVPAPRFADSLRLDVPINPLTDKGENILSISVDADNVINEGSESNNQFSRKFVIIEDEIRPISPFNLSIVNQQTVSFSASVSNPYAPVRTYMMELDTTELFNSSWKKTTTVQSAGGLVQFNLPGVIYSDSIVYYWRTAPVPAGGAPLIWNNASFIYLRNGSSGYGQGHFFQMMKNQSTNLVWKEDRQLAFTKKQRSLKIKTGIAPFYGGNSLLVTLDENIVVNFGCRYASLQIVVYDKATLEPWKNQAQSNGLGRFNSWPPCIHNNNAFEFPYFDATYRKRAIDFLESIPTGNLISLTNMGINNNSSFIQDWMRDTAVLGSAKSLYHTLKRLGFQDIDRFTQNVPFLFVVRKGESQSPIQMQMGQLGSDYIDVSMSIESSEVYGSGISPWFGPVQRWDRLHWSGRQVELTGDRYQIELWGKNEQGVEQPLRTIHQLADTTLTFVNAKQYPYLRLKINLSDSLNATPLQLRRWLLMGDFPPEGAIKPVSTIQSRDSVELGQPVPLELAFQNVSPTAFDSVDVKLTVTNAANVTTTIPTSKLKPIRQGDTTLFRYVFDTRKMPGLNTAFLQFNPDFLQPEQYLFNNFLFKSFYVKPDAYKPTLDVTFDGIRILNQDIVSSKPKIVVQLTDDSKFMLLDDTSLIRIKVRFPDNQIREYKLDNDTVRFTPAVFSNGIRSNTATVEFQPYFRQDGEYELIVTGSDKSSNASGTIDYKVAFSVVNKSMISNLLNYPNPFSTSTAFVFTLTGSELPQNLRIQILTITGKIVREITREELGTIRIGRNITDFKWDGTDQFGQKLANGIYLYRVITNLNGKSIDKLNMAGLSNDANDDSSTERYFRAGYGKMYLMR